MSTRKAYPSDLSDAQWAILEPLMPAQKPTGPRLRVDRREVVNAIGYVLRTGCQWRYLPEGFPNWNTVYWYFARWRDDGTWEQINDALRDRVRLKSGKKKPLRLRPSSCQSIKMAGQRGERGFDAGGKKVLGRKRHLQRG